MRFIGYPPIAVPKTSLTPDCADNGDRTQHGSSVWRAWRVACGGVSDLRCGGTVLGYCTREETEAMSPFAGLRLLMIAGLALLAMTHDVLAEKRVALVIGNSAHQSVARLPNPSKDANSIAQLLKKANFDVVSVQQDVGNLDFKRAIRKFEELAGDSDIAVVFYAGHGIEIGGVNYMIPVDAKLASDLDAPDEAIPLDRIVEAVEPARRLRLVILDACRDNPFVVNMKRQRQGGQSIRLCRPGEGRTHRVGNADRLRGQGWVYRG